MLNKIDTTNELTTMQKYNTRFNNGFYSHMKSIAVHSDYEQYHCGIFQHPEITEFMNIAIDAALEKCGHEHYKGAIMRAAQMSASFNGSTIAALDKFLLTFS